LHWEPALAVVPQQRAIRIDHPPNALAVLPTQLLHFDHELLRV
jgi:hypothetical protein